MYLSTFTAHFWDKVVEIVKTPLAWIGGLFVFFAEAVSNGKPIIYIIIAAVVIDLICGIAVAVKRKNFAKSELMRQTVEKLVVYGAAMLVFFGIDHVIEMHTNFTMDLTSGLVGAVITITETWSFLALLLILYPNNPFLKLLQKSLTGELARKLDCSEEEVAEILKASRKKQPRAKNGQFVSHKKK